MEARMLGEPGFDLGMLVGAVVIDDRMDIQMLRRIFVDSFDKLQKLLMPVALHALTDDFALQYIQCGE